MVYILLMGKKLSLLLLWDLSHTKQSPFHSIHISELETFSPSLQGTDLHFEAESIGGNL